MNLLSLFLSWDVHLPLPWTLELLILGPSESQICTSSAPCHHSPPGSQASGLKLNYTTRFPGPPADWLWGVLASITVWGDIYIYIWRTLIQLFLIYSPTCFSLFTLLQPHQTPHCFPETNAPGLIPPQDLCTSLLSGSLTSSMKAPLITSFITATWTPLWISALLNPLLYYHIRTQLWFIIYLLFCWQKINQ